MPKKLLKLYFIFAFMIFRTLKAISQSTENQLIKIYGLHPKSKIDSNLIRYAAEALPYFKDLKGAKIILRERRQLIPLTTIPAFSNLWHKKSNWKFKINVSTKSIGMLEPILVKNMPDSAGIGVIGHEFSHVKDFYSHRANYILKVFFWHISPRKMDKFEFETDHIAIKAGFGHYLKAWSKETHTRIPDDTFNRDKKGKRKHERYMLPETIEKYMQMYPNLYK
jgi:hypothetical protein